MALISYIVMAGTPTLGYCFYGPYATEEAAKEAATEYENFIEKDIGSSCEWWICKLERLEDKEWREDVQDRVGL